MSTEHRYTVDGRRVATEADRPELYDRAPAEAEHTLRTHIGVTLTLQELDEFRAKLGAAATQILADLLAARAWRKL